MTSKHSPKGSVDISGNVEESTIITGDGNTVNVSKTTVYTTPAKRLALIGTGVLLLIAATLTWLWFAYGRFDTSTMGGQLNIVVEPFLEETNGRYHASQQGLLLAQTFHAQLEEDVRSGQFEQATRIRAELRGPQEAPPLRNLLFTDPDVAAQKVAAQVNAHIVIYGIITYDDFDRPSVSIRFYISPDLFGDAQEILGENELGNPILLTGSLKSGADLEGENEELRNRVQVVSLVMKALGALLGEDYPTSLTYLDSALDDNLWKQTTGREVVYLLAGNVASRQALPILLQEGETAGLSAIQRAEDYYLQAIESAAPKGDYARAYIGLAGVQSFHATYQAKLTNDMARVNLSALDQEEQYLNSALSASYQPASADIPEKVAFNRAQVSLLRYQLSREVSHLTQAEAEYRTVILAYDSGNMRLRELAAHSHSGLALVARFQGQSDAAIQEYEAAFAITHTPSQQALYLYHIGNVYYELGDFVNALKYYASALDMKADLAKRLTAEQMQTLETRLLELQKSSQP